MKKKLQAIKVNNISYKFYSYIILNKMKKVYDYNIRVKVSVPESKKNLFFIVSIHSTIKELNTKVAAAMQLDPFITNLDFSFNDWYILPPESTLL